MSFRRCACGEPIIVRERVRAFGLKHGKDLSAWPERCATCVLERAAGMFLRADKA